MKKLLMTVFAVCALCGLEAKNNTYHVDNSGCVTVGACKISKDMKDDSKSIMNRKPNLSEITDTDPRHMKNNSNSWFKW